VFPVQPTTQLTLWKDARLQRSVTLSRLVGSDLRAWHGLWTAYGVTGSLFWRTPVFEVTSGWPTYREMARPSVFFWGLWRYEPSDVPPLVIVAVVPSNFVMLIVNGSLWDLARSRRILSAICSPSRIDQKVELRKWMPA
jgi:hypothetical protein